MIVWLAAVALAQECSVEQATAESFKPRAAEPMWVDPGGWDGKRFKGMAKERKKQFKSFKRQFASYPADAQADILNGVLREDLDEVATWLAWGPPTWTWKAEGKKCRNLLYAGVGDIDVVLNTCEGATESLFEIAAPIECDRLDAVVPRVDKKKKVSGDWSAEQMVAVLAGVPQNWMAKDDLEVAFGKPDKKRKKGTELMFLADDGLHEGPTVVLVDGLAESWTFPTVSHLTRSGERALKKGERLDKARKSVFQLLTAAAAVGMAIAEEQGAAQGGTVSQTHSSYRREIRLECNGEVLYDKVFTDKAACLAAERTTTLECMGHKMPFGC